MYLMYNFRPTINVLYTYHIYYYLRRLLIAHDNSIVRLVIAIIPTPPPLSPQTENRLGTIASLCDMSYNTPIYVYTRSRGNKTHLLYPTTSL